MSQYQIEDRFHDSLSILFQGVQLPGGIQLNGRQIYEDGLAEIEKLEEQLKNEYELPPIDLIG